MPAVNVVVIGYVQGVGFRAFMLDVAERLGVRGEVWNRREGAVEANAYHESQALLDEFVEVLSDGPGRVRDVCATPLSGYEPAAFTVGRTR